MAPTTIPYEKVVEMKMTGPPSPAIFEGPVMLALQIYRVYGVQGASRRVVPLWDPGGVT